MVADMRSFTAAGTALHITQSAVSNLIKELEGQVGVPLFDRTSRFVSLSPDGREFYGLAQKAFHEFLLMEKYAGDLCSLRAGRVRIVGAPLIACTLLPLLLAHFTRAQPNIRVELVDQPMAQVQSSIQQGDAEVGFGPARLPETDIIARHFFTTPVSMLSRPDHPLAGRHSTWSEVKKVPVVAVGRESVGYIAADVGTQPPFTIGHVVNQMPTAFALAAAGCGVALAGRFSLMLARARAWVPVIVAVLIRAYRMSRSVGWAMESRGLNLQGVRRTYRIQLKMRLSDWIILAVTVAATAGSIWLMLWQF